MRALSTLFAQPLSQSHRAVAGTIVVTLTLVLFTSAGGGVQAGSPQVAPVPRSILPLNVGVGIPTSQAVTIAFPEAMDQTSVEDALEITPAEPVALNWDGESRNLWVAPQGLWSTDRRYVLTVGQTARSADGTPLARAARFSFTTQTAPRVVDFRVRFVDEPIGGRWSREMEGRDQVEPLSDTASSISADTSIELAFNASMNRDEVARAFVLSPAVSGVIQWESDSLVFRPFARLTPGARYAVSLVGVHDELGNPLAGDSSFSFTVRPGAQLVSTTPLADAIGVRTDSQIILRFSEPMGPNSVALSVVDQGVALVGTTTWDAAYTQLQFTPARAWAAGHKFTVSLGPEALDADANPLAADWSFTTKPAAPRRPRLPRAAASSTTTGYALNQINAARAAYGLAPLWLDSAISAVAQAHAWDQVEYNYFSHTGRDGSSKQARLSAAGIVFGWAGENMCMDKRGWDTTTVLNWCYALFMSESYPGHPNHIGNILSLNYTRVGVGIAVNGEQTIIVWDFAN